MEILEKISMELLIPKHRIRIPKRTSEGVSEGTPEGILDGTPREILGGTPGVIPD